SRCGHRSNTPFVVVSFGTLALRQTRGIGQGGSEPQRRGHWAGLDGKGGPGLVRPASDRTKSNRTGAAPAGVPLTAPTVTVWLARSYRVLDRDRNRDPTAPCSPRGGRGTPDIVAGAPAVD